MQIVVIFRQFYNSRAHKKTVHFNYRCEQLRPNLCQGRRNESNMGILNWLVFGEVSLGLKLFPGLDCTAINCSLCIKGKVSQKRYYFKSFQKVNGKHCHTEYKKATIQKATTSI